MENDSITKIMTLKQIQGYTNKKLLDQINNIDNLDRIYNDLMIKNSLSIDPKENIKKILDYCNNQNIKIISYFDKKYPQKLKYINSPPLILFYKGNIDLIDKSSISIVGTRYASDKALKWTYKTAKELSLSGFVIISGGAEGIDTEAHKGSLEGTGETISVLGSGLDNIFPKDNEGLIKQIMERGLVLTEYPPRNNVNKYGLLERNRVTSGLGDCVLIVASSESGGSISQYKVAISQKKKILLPNPNLGLEPIEGIIKLINNKDNNVRLISDISDILNEAKINKKQISLHCFI